MLEKTPVKSRLLAQVEDFPKILPESFSCYTLITAQEWALGVPQGDEHPSFPDAVKCA
jgi:hypothetical protein